MKKFITEGIATFFLMLVILMATGPLAPLYIGLLLIALVYSGMQLSGSHFNPAVSLVMLLQGKITRDELPLYIFAQLIGAALAAAISAFLLTAIAHPDITVRTNHVFAALVSEFIATFALLFVILNVAVPQRVAGNAYYGVAIGLAVTGLIATFGEVSGAVMNPAVAIGLAIAGKLSWGDLWFYMVGAFLGASAASTVFTLTENSAS